MEEVKKYSLLLSILAMLFIIKIFIVPIIDWQNNTLLEINNIERKLGKIEKGLSKESKLIALNQKVTNELERAEQLFFKTQTESLFKLEQQQKLEALLEKYQINVTNISWSVATPLKEYGLTKYQAKIRFDTKLVKAIDVLTALEKNSPWFEVDEFYLPVKIPESNSIGYSKGGRMTLNLYMFTKEFAVLTSNTVPSSLSNAMNIATTKKVA